MFMSGHAEEVIADRVSAIRGGSAHLQTLHSRIAREPTSRVAGSGSVARAVGRFARHDGWIMTATSGGQDTNSA